MLHNLFHGIWGKLARFSYSLGIAFLVVSLVLSVLPIAPAAAQASGAIWTTSGTCNNPQDKNHYTYGDPIVINGENFDPGTYDWQIKGTPGSADPNIVVASGQISPDENGEFCFSEYNVQPDDAGEYKVKVGSKGDNYRVVGDPPTNTPLPTNTPTDTPDPTNTPTAEPTSTPTDVPTDTPTSTPTDTPTSTPTDTPTSTPTDTLTPTATYTPGGPTLTTTNTPLPPTETPTSVPTETPTPDPTQTPTPDPTQTPTPDPTSTNTPVPTAPPPDSTEDPGETVLIPVTGPETAPWASANPAVKQNYFTNTSAHAGFVLFGLGLVFHGLSLWQKRKKE